MRRSTTINVRTSSILWIVVALVVFTGGGVAVYTMTRGLRNNNPGNIRHGDKWQGMAPDQTDNAFVKFIEPEFGIRAMVRILRKYYARGLVSVRQIISTWAPPSENDTESYMLSVAKKLNVDPDDRLALDNALPDLITAIIRHENGVQPYSAITIARGIELERRA